MKNKVILRLLLITTLVLLILACLYVFTDMPNKHNNGFSRNMLTSDLKVLKETDFVEPLNKIWSVSGNQIYLTGETPKSILMISKDLLKKDTIGINLTAPEDKLVPYTICVDTPFLYVHMNNLKSVIHGKYPDQKLNKRELKTQVFTKSVQVSPASMVIRTFDRFGKKQVFQKISTISGEVVKEADIVPGQGEDLGMASDGAMHYEKSTGTISYVEYFRNRFYLIDTNLNVKVSGKTIDTVAFIDVKKQMVDEGGGKSKIIPGKARVKVNKDSFMDGAYLYVVSAFRADNESRGDFNRYSVIDRYRLADGKYGSSFYVDKVKEKPFKSAIVSGDTLFTLYNGKMVLYKLPK
ncbi:hypothetical protein [Pedobacter heparinus]|uniref:Uncharacterized protein n=1 Tax=Pedobacter heparinus (strain ATCC 13125 / DSM 2366 / CIP 104194 / JCM 7457 / NBRC 12017 / NCIMB 9290 / NRRL B-14731 / HIM 762-3) TaxID=485917 RepID=C6Y2S1_PEDHD|nr:hypothetical protein [Pedobacter heparinus]ACU03134.1 hypothetical protein Phep_0912 [Pedobacter heparinus DSM 2366]